MLAKVCNNKGWPYNLAEWFVCSSVAWRVLAAAAGRCVAQEDSSAVWIVLALSDSETAQIARSIAGSERSAGAAKSATSSSSSVVWVSLFSFFALLRSTVDLILLVCLEASSFRSLCPHRCLLHHRRKTISRLWNDLLPNGRLQTSEPPFVCLFIIIIICYVSCFLLALVRLVHRCHQLFQCESQ